MNSNDDTVYPFHLQDAGVRGQVVHLDSTWQEILAHSSYPRRVQQLLGESLAASALFAAALKFEGRLSIQLRHAGSLNLLFAECTHDGGLRGIARCEDGATDQQINLSSAQAQLALTIENHQTDARYQGLVAVESSTLAGAFETYFERSEQLPSRILLVERDGRCAGLMLQKIADSALSNDPDAWNRISHLLATLSDSELLDLPVETLLLRLFHDEGVVLQEGRSLRFECSCSQERVLVMLRSLGRDQALEALGESSEMEITCEFCNRSYAVDPVDLTGLFSDTPLAPGTPSRH
ncbi:MAG: Hsp33 family molecular chaperone HslO [Dokdonella sp.]